MKIGDIEIKGSVVLGPMAGVTTLAYREFMLFADVQNIREVLLFPTLKDEK